MTVVYIRWQDACEIEGEVEEDELPAPVIFESVGKLSKETDDYIVLCRDYDPEWNMYGSPLCIPKAYVVERIDFET